MKPILFSESATSYTTNGIGRLSDAISCVVTEERNGSYELVMEYPTTGIHYEDITIRSIIVVKPSANANLQAFRIYSITKPIGGRVTINAQHISYDLSKNVAMPFSVAASASTCKTVLQALKRNAVESCPFSFSTDVTTVASYDQTVPASIRSRLGGVEGSVLDQFGGEFEWDNWNVILHEARGEERDITLRYGKNITDLTQEENIANTVTGVVPYWTNTDNSEKVTLPEKVVYSSNASRYSSRLTVPLDLSSEWDEAPTEDQLRTKAQVYVNETGFGLPKVSIELSFVNLADTEEYKDILPLEEVNLCDIIKVQFEELGIDTTAKVVKTEYDVLKEKYISLQIGSLKSTLATTINDMNSNMASSIANSALRTYEDAGSTANDLVDNATAWLTSSGGYVIAVKNTDGTWKELLFMDTNDVDTAINVLRVNENGIGFSSNGVSGPYTQAWTLDGRLIIGGTNVPSLTCYDSGGNIIFQAARDGVIWNAANSSMTRTGKLTITNADITDGTIKLGGENDGVLKMYDEDNRLMGEWTRDHLIFQKPGTNHSIELTNDDDNSILLFDDDSYIDGTGSGGEEGLHFNAENVTFSVDNIFVTSYRNGSSYSTGYSGDVITGLNFSELTDVCCDLQGDGSGGFSWNSVSFEFVNGYSSNRVLHGIVVE